MRPVATLVICLPAIAHAGTPLLEKLQCPDQVWSRDGLAKALFQACRETNATPTRNEIQAWAKLLEVDRPLKTDASLTSGVQVREVALTCIEELTGEEIYGHVASSGGTREILSLTGKDGVERFHISQIDPKDLPAIEKAVQKWLAHH